MITVSNAELKELVDTVRAIEDCMKDPARWAEVRLIEAGLLDKDRAYDAWPYFVEDLRNNVVDDQGNPAYDCDDEDDVVEASKDLFENRESSFQLFYCLYLLQYYKKKDEKNAKKS